MRLNRCEHHHVLYTKKKNRRRDKRQRATTGRSLFAEEGLPESTGTNGVTLHHAVLALQYGRIHMKIQTEGGVVPRSMLQCGDIGE